MPLADSKEIKQNEENNLLDFRLQGTQITLQSRPSPSSSRSSSRLDSAFRAMSATPTLSYQEKHRKTPPWTRPQSADHLSRGSQRRKLAAKFERGSERRTSKSKGGGSMSNLLESSSIEDGLDSEASIGASPVPSLSEVLRSSGKLEPGLAGKPPLPPGGLVHNRREHKSLDDIINIKFQRWFPEAIQETYADSVDQLTNANATNGYVMSSLKESKSSENLNELRNSSGTPETQINLNYPIQFEAYESPRLDSGRKLPRTQTMETIQETDDPSSHERVPLKSSDNNFSSKNENLPMEEGTEFLKSKVGQSLNKFFEETEGNNHKKRVTIHENVNTNDERQNVLIEDEKARPSTSNKGLETADANAKRDFPNPSPTPDQNHISEKTFRETSNTVEGYPQELPGEPQRTGLNNEDILTWMGNGNGYDIQDKNLGSSTFSDIIKMLKVLEKEEVESLKLEALSVNRSNNNSACSNLTIGGTSCRDILTFLDDVDRTDSTNQIQPVQVKHLTPNSERTSNLPPGRMGQLLSLDATELAQRVMALSLELEEKSLISDRAQSQLKEAREKIAKQKSDSDSIIKRHQKFIDQLLQEKRMLGEQCASIIKEMEEKHAKTLASIESRNQIELKKLQEKMLAAEKLRREKWESEKIKKIKEQTVKGLEPELERLTRAHADELTELRRVHDRELAEMEAACSRRIVAARDQALRDREQAVADERDAARKKLESELAEVERSYQEQRRRLLVEVRDEKERVEREGQAEIALRTRQLEEKWAQAEHQLQARMAALQEKHESELKTMRDTLEGERQSWLSHQTVALAEKEKEIRQTVKKERDRHIEAVIRRLDLEAQEKEKSLEAKIVRMKEEYESELKESESSLHEMKRKLKDARTEIQEYEELISKLRTQVTQLECQLTTAKQQIERLEYERSESKSLARSEVCSQIATLQRELSEERMKREEALAALQAEKERELQQVYNRVKEAISKKEETLRMVQKQRDAALEQCAQLEAMVEEQRKELAIRK